MTTISIILGLLPGLAWLLFYLKEDLNPEPRKLIALVFVNGMAFAFIALILQIILNQGLNYLDIITTSLIAVFLLSLIEEVIKFLAAYMAVHRSPSFDEPVDAMVYSVIAALGFATVENIGILTGTPSFTITLSQAVSIITFRFIGATLLHTLSSALIGYGWAISIKKFKRLSPLIFGILAATVLHSAFNLIILNYGTAVFATFFLVIFGFVVLSRFSALRNSLV